MPSRNRPAFSWRVRSSDAAHLETGFAHHRVDDFRAPLGAAVLGVHRIQHHGAVGVEAHPVVRKHGVGLARGVGVRHHAYTDALRGQRRGESVEFPQCPLRDFAGDTAILTAGLLEAIGAGGLRVEAEVFRANHQNGAGALRRAAAAPEFPTLHYRLLHPGRGRHNSPPCPTPYPHSMRAMPRAPQFAQDIAAAYEEFGFVIIENHGIDKRAHRPLPRLLPPVLRAAREPKSSATRCRAAAARAATRPSASKPPRAPSTTISRSSGTSAASCRRGIRSTRSWRLTSGWIRSRASASRRWACTRPSTRSARGCSRPSRARSRCRRISSTTR